MSSTEVTPVESLSDLTGEYRIQSNAPNQRLLQLDDAWEWGVTQGEEKPDPDSKRQRWKLTLRTLGRYAISNLYPLAADPSSGGEVQGRYLEVNGGLATEKVDEKGQPLAPIYAAKYTSAEADKFLNLQWMLIVAGTDPEPIYRIETCAPIAPGETHTNFCIDAWNGGENEKFA